MTEPQQQRPLRIVIVGHVDHGKSTLIGRLFNDTGSLPEGKLEAIQATCKRRGVPFEWAFLMDALQAERDQNVTIDSAQIWFNTEKRPYVIIDAPGHKEFLKNMVTGAASADAAVLLIAANEGVREQSRRHGYLLSLLGIQQVFVAVNKMDLVDYDPQVFDTIRTEFTDFLAQLGVTPQRFIPISARDGQNVATQATDDTPWYDGPSILEALDHFELPQPLVDQPLRFPIQDIYRFDHRRILAGRIETGTLRVGDTLHFAPKGERARIASIERWSAPAAEVAYAGESVGITLDEQIFVERGDVAVHTDALPTTASRFRANLFWMGKNPVEVGKLYKLKLTTQEIAARVVSIERVINASTLDAEADFTRVQRNDVGELILETRSPVVFDPHHTNEALGRFVIVDDYDVAGGGIILEARDVAQQPSAPRRQLRTLLWLVADTPTSIPPARAQLQTLLTDLPLFPLGRDTLAEGLNADLSETSADDRLEAFRRTIHVATLFAHAGHLPLITATAHDEAALTLAREIANEQDLTLIEIPVRDGAFEASLLDSLR